jgi:capsular polysaccharide biosynthesis protein
VFDNALVLPEYLVEFDYVINKNSAAETKRLSDVIQLNSECNKLFKGITETQRVLENTYIRYVQKDNPRFKNVHLTTNDLDRSDMGCLKKNLH